MSDSLTKTVEDRRKIFLDELAEGFTTLRHDERAWQEELKERRAWDTTLSDNLDEVEVW